MMQNDFHSATWADHHQTLSRDLAPIAGRLARGTRRLFTSPGGGGQLLAGAASLALTSLVVTTTTL